MQEKLERRIDDRKTPIQGESAWGDYL